MTQISNSTNIEIQTNTGEEMILEQPLVTLNIAKEITTLPDNNEFLLNIQNLCNANEMLNSSMSNISTQQLILLNEPTDITLQSYENIPQNQITKETNKRIYCILHPEDLQLKLPSCTNNNVPKRGRPKKIIIKELEEDSLLQEIDEEVPCKVFRTKSGRLSKPPKHMQQGSSILNNKTDVSEIENESTTNPQTEIIPNESTTNIQTENIPNNQHPVNNNEINSVELPTENHCTTHKKLKNIPNKHPTYKRNISSQYRCGTCQKAYLGRAKMEKHLNLNPTHLPPPSFNESCLTYFIEKTKKNPKENQAKLFCEEFTTLVHKARHIIPKMLKPEIIKTDDTFIVDQVISNTLGIPEGYYSFIENKDANKIFNEACSTDVSEMMNISNTVDNLTQHVLMNNENHINSLDSSDNLHNNDQNNLLMNLLDTGQVTFDTANPEDVISVDQLIHERLKTLTDGEMEPNHSNQNLNLDLSLDMFSYVTNCN